MAIGFRWPFFLLRFPWIETRGYDIDHAYGIFLRIYNKKNCIDDILRTIILSATNAVGTANIVATEFIPLKFISFAEVFLRSSIPARIQDIHPE